MQIKILFRKTPRAACLSCLCLALLPMVGSAATLELADALQLAQKTNPELDALLNRSAAARARVDAAGALPDPKAQFTYFGESVETRTGPQEAIYSISQTIPWLSKLSTREALARQEAETVASFYEEAQRRIDEAITRTYTDAVYYREAIRTTESNLQWIRESQPIVEESVRSGASVNALLRIEVEMERLRDQMEQYEQAHHTERARLAALIGLSEDELGPLGELPKPAETQQALPSLQQTMLQQNPTLQSFQSQTRRAGLKTELSQLDRYPDITLGINYIQVGNNGAPVRDAGKDPWNVTIGINLPIWDGANRARTRAALSEKRAAEGLYRSRSLELRAELSASLSKLSTSLRRVERHRETLIPLAEQALENSRTAYESGQITILELIDSERALLELKLNFLRATADSLQSEAMIRRLTGSTPPSTQN